MKPFNALPTLAVAPQALAAINIYHTGGMQLGPPVQVTNLTGGDRFSGWGTFDQLVDHSDPSLGTFPQRFWYSTQFWRGSGSPVILMTPGEQAADDFNTTYTTDARLTGVFAQATGGAVVVLEHRYWGDSSPFEDLTAENLAYLTLENSVVDLTYFARNFDAPFDSSGGSAPTEAPWILSGGSYSGALAGWTAALDPGTFWAYHGTSGVVEAVGDFWRYFVPVLEATPKNCSKDLVAAIDRVDDILLHGSDKEKQALKDKFGLGELLDADFGGALEWGPWQWQSNDFASFNYTGNTYYQFCDYIENAWPNSTSRIPDSRGVGASKALDGYAKWFKEVAIPGTCEQYGYNEFKGKTNTLCFQNLNASNPIFTDLSVRNSGNRQWNWMLCNEPFEFWQDGAPKDQPSIVSRLVNSQYWTAQCAFWFPGSPGRYGIARGESAAAVNTRTGGWAAAAKTNATARLMYVNGERDPWREATVSAQSRPGGPLGSTEELPVWIVPGGFHCSDLYGDNWVFNSALRGIVREEIATVKKWVAEFHKEKSNKKRGVEWVA